MAQGSTRGSASVQVSTDGTMVANSDLVVPSQKAVKTYADTKQTADATLTAFAAVGSSANIIPYFTGTDTFATTRFEITGIQSFSPTVTWTGTTPPSSTQTAAYAWQRVGKMVILDGIIRYAVAGTALTTAQFALPTDMPIPNQWAGLTSANQNLLTGGAGGASTSLTAVGNAARVSIQNNGGATGADIVCTFASTNLLALSFSITYFTS